MSDEISYKRALVRIRAAVSDDLVDPVRGSRYG
ncbi:hypothetical protein HEB94_000418 [Actinopolymorpha pittospori]|uniref:Uncharacterized protein n=1 Tax=Actinopolymorpha pittospori TaxID=648752 RepID=A0A927R926_9ACTN|nr:hypothetical protein [Actinopolymorpha pittospori]